MEAFMWHVTYPGRETIAMIKDTNNLVVRDPTIMFLVTSKEQEGQKSHIPLPNDPSQEDQNTHHVDRSSSCDAYTSAHVSYCIRYSTR